MAFPVVRRPPPPPPPPWLRVVLLVGLAAWCGLIFYCAFGR